MDFFKKLFTAKPKEISLEQIELKDWLENNSGSALKEENSKIKESLNKIKEYKNELREKLHALEKAELMNKDIHERERHIMVGNRHNYIAKSMAFLSGIMLPEFNYEKLKAFCENFTDRLEALNDDTGKGYFILKNFFEHEMRDIANAIKKIEAEIIAIDGMLDSEKVSELSVLFLKIRELNESVVESEKLSVEINDLEKSLREYRIKKEVIASKLSSLKESDEYRSYFKIEKEKKDIDSAIFSLNSRLNNSIKQIDKLLKKIMHGSPKEEFILRYLVTPIEALADDKKNELLSILSHASSSIPELNLKEKDAEKIQKNLNEITAEYFDSVRKEYETLLARKKAISELIERSSIIMDYKELEYQLEHIAAKIKKAEEEKLEKKDILSRLAPSKKAEKVQERLSAFSKMKITVRIN